MKFRVYYDATDAGKVMYHTEYLKFCEEARSEIFFKNNIFFENEGYVVKELNAKFLKPAKLGDIIEVKTKIKKILNASIKATQTIYKDNEEIFILNITLVFIKNNKISKIPLSHKKILDEYS